MAHESDGVPGLSERLSRRMMPFSVAPQVASIDRRAGSAAPAPRRFVSHAFADGVVFGATSVRSVHIGTVVDTQDTDDPGIAVDPIDHPVRTSTGCPQSG